MSEGEKEQRRNTIKKPGQNDKEGEENFTVVKKYANRRLYNTGTSTYVTLDDLAEMVQSGEDFVVYDAKTGEEITRSVLTQIIFELENKGHNMLPTSFLRQLIRFYGDSMQALVPSYLTFSLDSFVRDQNKFRDQMMQALGSSPFEAMEEQVKRNTAMFEQAMRMFSPFPHAASAGVEEKAPAPETEQSNSDIEALRKQLSEMEARIEKLSKSRD